MFLTAAMTLQDLPRDVLESFYWDCDTMFMKGELGGQDMWTCLQITEEFQKTFKSKEDFKQYWLNEQTKQWRQRGFVKD
jgi:hypothetical protein